MNRLENLRTQLQTVFDKLAKDNTLDAIGSLPFWYDEYGAHIRFSPWQLSEMTWHPGHDNNISLEQFDEFEDSDCFIEVVTDFFNGLRDHPSLLGLPLRDGFQFVLSEFDSYGTGLGEPIKGLVK